MISERFAADLKDLSVSYTFQFSFTHKFASSTMSGKQKKGACRIHAGEWVFAVHATNRVESTQNPLIYKFGSPIGGKLLETNDNLIRKPELLVDEFRSAGFVAVLYPEAEIPHVEGCKDYASLLEKIRSKRSRSHLCFAFLESGTCARGDQCKFLHEAAATVSHDEGGSSSGMEAEGDVPDRHHCS